MTNMKRIVLILAFFIGPAAVFHAPNAECWSLEPLTYAKTHGGHVRTTALETISPTNLPREARHTLELIKAGGPFPYPKDGTVFGNREKRLPEHRHGYYREYTVKTPGRRDRGARRIIAGSGGEFYYTEDHYNTFKLIKE